PAFLGAAEVRLTFCLTLRAQCAIWKTSGSEYVCPEQQAAGLFCGPMSVLIPSNSRNAMHILALHHSVFLFAILCLPLLFGAERLDRAGYAAGLDEKSAMTELGRIASTPSSFLFGLSSDSPRGSPRITAAGFSVANGAMELRQLIARPGTLPWFGKWRPPDARRHVKFGAEV